MRFLVFLLFILFSVSWGSCDMINPSEQIPTYVHIDSFQFISTPNTGTSSHKIISVAAYFDYAPLGTFDLPANIPILTDKPGSLMLLPSVMYSGLNDVIVPYSFYKADTVTIHPKPGDQIHYTPKTQYWGDSVLSFTFEDFESGNSFTPLEGDTLKITSDPNYVFEGSYGGIIELKDSAYATNIMTRSFSAPVISANRTEAYLEVNYKGTLDFEIGLQTSQNGNVVIQYLYGFRSRSDWNKVYVGLQDFLTLYQNSSYRVLVHVVNNSQQSGYVAFDNFKIVTRK